MATLYDYTGRPLDTSSDLDERIADARVGTVRTPVPRDLIAGLSPLSLKVAMVDARQGRPETMLSIAATMERRWAHYRSQVTSRKMSVIGLPRMVIADTDDDRDIQIAEELTAIASGEVADSGVTGMLDALSKGYSLVEIVWDRTRTPWVPREFVWRNPQHFVVDRWDYETLRLRTDEQPVDGVPLEPGKWIAHCPQIVMGLPIEGSLAWGCASMYMIGSMGLRDWVAFLEVFGMPVRVGRVPDAASEETRKKLLRQLARIGTDAAAVISQSQNIEFIDRGRVPGAKDIFIGFLDWVNNQVSKVVTGQTASSEGGTSLAHAKVQNEVRLDIVRADATQAARSWTRFVNRPYVGYNYGLDVTVPETVYVVEEPEDLKEFSEALAPLLAQGLTVEASQLRDKFRLDSPADGAEVVGGGAKADSRTMRAVNNLRRSAVQRTVASYAERHGLRRHPSGIYYRRSKRGHVQVPRLDHRIAELCEAINKHAYGRRPGENPPDVPAIDLHEVADQDEVDNLRDDAVSNWSEVMGPIVDALQLVVDDATDEDDLRARLESALSPEDMDILIRSIGTQNFKARGLGDVADHPSGDPEA